MSAHHPVRDSQNYAYECICGWKTYAMGRQDAHEMTYQHVYDEWDKESAAAKTEKERVRLLTEGQNWDIA